jgi:AcrR family transcriptional regulator
MDSASSPRLWVAPSDADLDFSGTRGRILTGAMQAFQERGVPATTVEHILRSAGVSRGTFYEYFENKEDVLSSVFAYSVHLLVERIRAAIADVEDPAVKVERSIDAYLAMQLEQGRLIQGMWVEALRPGSRMAEMREWAIQNVIEFIDSSVFTAQHRRADPLVYRGLLASIEGLTMYFQDRGAMNAAGAQLIRRVIIPIIGRTMALPGDPVPDLPQPRE